MTPFKNNVFNQLVFLPVYLIGLLPYSISSAIIGQMLYFVSYRIFKYRYSVVLQNLSRSLPSKSYAEIQQIATAFYRNFSCMMIETLQLFSMSSYTLNKKVHLLNPELLLSYHKQNRSIIAVLGHYGNWEYLNILPELLPFKVNAIYKPLSNSMMNTLIKQLRSRFGMRLIPANQALRYLLKQQHEPQLSIFIADQFPGFSTYEQFNFLHQPTQMFNGAEKLAKTVNAVVIYLEMKRSSNNCWEIGFSLITERPRETAKQEITQCFAAKLEQTIQTDPGYWLWSHRRWKH